MSNFDQIKHDYSRYYIIHALRHRGAIRGIAIFKWYWYGRRVDRYVITPQPRTGKQQGWKAYFYDAVKNWQTFNDSTKAVYNKEAIPYRVYGYHRYLKHFLKAQGKMIIYWGPLSKNASDTASPDAYMSSERFQGVQKLLSRNDYPAGFPYGALFYHDPLDMMLGLHKAGWKKVGAAEPHHLTHENGGDDEISVVGLSGALADNQPSDWSLISSKPSTFAPAAHHTDHENGGGDEISVSGLSGTLADAQTAASHAAAHVAGDAIQSATSAQTGLATAAQITKLDGIASGADVTANNAPKAHKASHQNGGSDETGVTASTANALPKADANGQLAKEWINNLDLTPAPGADHTCSGIKVTLTAGVNMAIGDVGYIASTGKVALGKGDAIATGSCVVMCADATISADAAGSFLLFGIARDDTWAWTVGGLIYLSITGTTANTLTQTAPSATNNVIQIVGVATHADRMLFSPQLVQVEHT